MTNVPTEEVLDLSPFKKLVATIGNLPSAFTESMTYYEALAYFVHYLEKTVIPAINQNANATKELQNLFVELKKYVDNYFDNLDVQEMINNKLDAMVLDGTLARIINQEIFDELNTRVNQKANKTYVDETFLPISHGDGDHLGVGNETYTSPSSWTSTVFSARSNRTSTQPESLKSAPGVFSPHTSAECAEYYGRDSVAAYIGAQGRNPYLYVYNDNAIVYTSNTVNYPENADISKIKVGMVIDTNHATPYTGLITAIDTVNHKFTVEGNWFKVGGTAELPPNGYGYKVGQVRKIWGKNTVINLYPELPQTDGVGEEMNLNNFLPAGTTKQLIGYDVVALGSGAADIGYLARTNDGSGRLLQGFVSHNTTEGFTTESDNDDDFLLVSKTKDKVYNRRRFSITNNGTMTNPILREVEISADEQLPNPQYSVWIFKPTQNINYTLPNLLTDGSYDKKIYLFLNRSNYTVTFDNNPDRTLSSNSAVVFYANKSYGWIRIANFTL